MLDALPYDILSLVTEFLPLYEVRKLAAVNRRLRHAVGLDAKFREIKLDRHDSRMKGICEMLRFVFFLIGYLGGDADCGVCHTSHVFAPPIHLVASFCISSAWKFSRRDVANHVRRLTMQPWLVRPGTKTHASRSENMWNHVNTFFNPHYMEQQADRRIRKRVRKDIARVTDAIRRLRYVEEYCIIYDEESRYHREFFNALLSPTLETFAPTLYKLTIKVPFELLPHLSYVRLPELHQLDICLCTGEAFMDQIKYALDGFFVFLHNITTLQHLGISVTSFSRRLDISHFSQRWGKFPDLKSLSLCIPFNGAALSSPEGFYEHVVKPHASTLEKLRLSTTRASVPLGPVPRHCQNWIQRIIKSSFDTPFPRLREVELALRPLRANLDDLKTFLENRAPTLEKLTLTDRALQVHELKELFESLCLSRVFPSGRNDMLESLKMKVDVLSPTLLVLAAECFPELKSLNLTFADVWSASPDLRGRTQQNLVCNLLNSHVFIRLCF